MVAFTACHDRRSVIWASGSLLGTWQSASSSELGRLPGCQAARRSRACVRTCTRACARVRAGSPRKLAVCQSEQVKVLFRWQPAWQPARGWQSAQLTAPERPMGHVRCGRSSQI